MPPLNTLDVTHTEYSPVAAVSTELGDVPPFWCYPSELSQVFVNLIVNAAHAIDQMNKESGRELGELRIATRVTGDKLEIRIEDDGAGMPKAVIARIFDPFFTTKAVGKGTGQGLAIARSIIVELHGGSIDVTSEPGVGTTFIITLLLEQRRRSGKRSTNNDSSPIVDVSNTQESGEGEPL